MSTSALAENVAECFSGLCCVSCDLIPCVRFLFYMWILLLSVFRRGDQGAKYFNNSDEF